MEVHEIDKEFFTNSISEGSTKNWHLKTFKPVIVDFFATWCGPCKALSPLLDEIAEEYADKLLIFKVDVDKNEELAADFNIRMVPTLLFSKPSDNKPTLMLGVMGKAELKEHIESLLLS